MSALHVYCFVLVAIKDASLPLESRSKYGKVSLFTAMLLVLASILRAIWSAQQISFQLCGLDIAVRASEAWTPC